MQIFNASTFFKRQADRSFFFPLYHNRLFCQDKDSCGENLP